LPWLCLAFCSQRATTNWFLCRFLSCPTESRPHLHWHSSQNARTQQKNRRGPVPIAGCLYACMWPHSALVFGRMLYLHTCMGTCCMECSQISPPAVVTYALVIASTRYAHTHPKPKLRDGGSLACFSRTPQGHTAWQPSLRLSY